MLTSSSRRDLIAIYTMPLLYLAIHSQHSLTDSFHSIRWSLFYINLTSNISNALHIPFPPLSSHCPSLITALSFLHLFLLFSLPLSNHSLSLLSVPLLQFQLQPSHSLFPLHVRFWRCRGTAKKPICGVWESSCFCCCAASYPLTGTITMKS